MTTFYRWDGQVYNVLLLMWSSFGILCTKVIIFFLFRYFPVNKDEYIKIGSFLTELFKEDIGDIVFLKHGVIVVYLEDYIALSRIA